MKSSKKIISLVPSLTELLVDLGLGESVIGRTRFCIHPKKVVEQIPIIGGTKNPNLEKIRALNPDIVLANKEENRKEDIDQIAQHCKVILTEIDTISDALTTILHIGNQLNAQTASEKLVASIKAQIPEKTTFNTIKTAYFIWKEPWMSVGHDTYIHDVMSTFGLQNVCAHYIRYPTMTLDSIQKLSPELLLLSSEPFPFQERHVHDLSKKFPGVAIQLINGEWFSWYGSRMLPSFTALKTWRNSLSS